MNEKIFQAKLRQFIRLLKQEQKFLIADDGAALTELVPKKADFVPLFEQYAGAIGTTTKELIQEIQELQETNLLLTQQALAYQQKIMETIQKSLAKQEVPYGKAAKQVQSAEHAEIPAAIVDQSF